MKKFLKGIAVMLALALVITPCAILFAGCGEADIVGEWKLYQYYYIEDGVKETVNIGDPWEGSTTLSENFMKFRANADGSFSILVGDDEETGTWTKDGDIYVFASASDPNDLAYGKIEDGKLRFFMIMEDPEAIGYIFQK